MRLPEPWELTEAALRVETLFHYADRTAQHGQVVRSNCGIWILRRPYDYQLRVCSECQKVLGAW